MALECDNCGGIHYETKDVIDCERATIVMLKVELAAIQKDNTKDCVCADPSCKLHPNDIDLMETRSLIGELSDQDRRDTVKAFAAFEEVSGSIHSLDDDELDEIVAKEEIEQLVKNTPLENFGTVSNGEVVVNTGIYKHEDGSYHTRPDCLCLLPMWCPRHDS